MSKISDEDDLKPSAVFVEDAEAQPRHLGSYSQNVNAKIYNPLAGVSKVDLFDRVHRFCQEFGFDDEVDTFQKGALAAQHQKGFEDLAELTEEDKYHLRREYTRSYFIITQGLECILTFDLDR